MSEMFHGCSSLTSLDLTPLNTAKVTNMESMFYRCSGLTSLDLTPLNTANVTSMKSMFYSCSGLTSLDLTSFNTAKVTNMSSMFYDCSGLTTIKTGVTFKFARTDYFLSGTWRNVIGETFNGDYGTANFPSNVADTYIKVS
jgi:surface protein